MRISRRQLKLIGIVQIVLGVAVTALLLPLHVGEHEPRAAVAMTGVIGLLSLFLFLRLRVSRS